MPKQQNTAAASRGTNRGRGAASTSSGKGTRPAAEMKPATAPEAKAPVVVTPNTVADAGTGQPVSAVVFPTGEDGKPMALEPKCAAIRVQSGRPHPSLLQVIEWKGNHPGKALRIRRWHRYEVGMSVLHCRITEGLDHLDIGFYVKNGLMRLRPMTDEERKVALARWEGEAVEAQPAATGAGAESAADAGTEATAS